MLTFVSMTPGEAGGACVRMTGGSRRRLRAHDTGGAGGACAHAWHWGAGGACARGDGAPTDLRRPSAKTYPPSHPQNSETPMRLPSPRYTTERTAVSNRRAQSAASASGVPANPITSPTMRGGPA